MNFHITGVIKSSLPGSGRTPKALDVRVLFCDVFVGSPAGMEMEIRVPGSHGSLTLMLQSLEAQMMVG